MAEKINVGKFINNIDKEDLSSEKLQGVVNNVYAKAIKDHKQTTKIADDNLKDLEKETVEFVKSNHDRLKANKETPDKELNENYSVVDLSSGERFGNYDSVESARVKALQYYRLGLAEGRLAIVDDNLNPIGWVSPQGKLNKSIEENKHSTTKIVESFERALKPGDKIVVRGTEVTIGNIIDQYYDKDYIDIEFEDDKGNYRSWKSDIDGGKVVYKESKQLGEDVDEFEVAKYKGNQYGIWSKSSKNWMTFGKKKDLEKQVKELNAKKSKKLKEGITPDNIYDALVKELPAEDIGHHESDLYVRKTPKSTEIINKLDNKSLLSTFVDNIDKEVWYELPFCYTPFWNSKSKQVNETSYRGLAYYEYRGCKVRETPSTFVAINEHGLNIGESPTAVGAEGIIDDYLEKKGIKAVIGGQPKREGSFAEKHPNIKLKKETLKEELSDEEIFDILGIEQENRTNSKHLLSQFRKLRKKYGTDSIWLKGDVGSAVKGKVIGRSNDLVVVESKELTEGKKIDLYVNGEYVCSSNKYKRAKDFVDAVKKDGKVTYAGLDNNGKLSDKVTKTIKDTDKVVGRIVTESKKLEEGRSSKKLIYTIGDRFVAHQLDGVTSPFNREFDAAKKYRDISNDPNFKHGSIGCKGKSYKTGVNQWVKDVEPTEFMVWTKKENPSWKDDVLDVYYRKETVNESKKIDEDRTIKNNRFDETTTFEQWFDATFGDSEKYRKSKYYPFKKYIKSFPSAESLKNATAADIVKNAHIFYDVYDVDSADREYAFNFASDVTGRDYDDFYNAWISGTPLNESKKLKEAINPKFQAFYDKVNSDKQLAKQVDYLYSKVLKTLHYDMDEIRKEVKNRALEDKVAEILEHASLISDQPNSKVAKELNALLDESFIKEDLSKIQEEQTMKLVRLLGKGLITKQEFEEKLYGIIEPKLVRAPMFKDTKIKDFYTDNYPTDDLGEEINDTVTVQDVVDLLNDGRGDDFYSLIGVSDSVVRERVLAFIADACGVKYDVVYKKWLGEDLNKKSNQPITEARYNDMVFKGQHIASVDLYSTGCSEDDIKKREESGGHYEIDLDNKVFTKVQGNHFLGHYFIETYPRDTWKEVEQTAKNIMKNGNFKEVSNDEYIKIQKEWESKNK